MKYTTCPRCQGEWKQLTRPRTQISEEIAYDGNDPEIVPGILICNPCNMRYDLDFEEVHLRNLINNGIMLVWDTKSNRCLYGDFEAFVKGTATVLPWLPYDISIVKLKTYLLFS